MPPAPSGPRTTDPLASLPALLAFLATLPSPDAVAAALGKGLLGDLGPSGVHLFERVDGGEGGVDELVSIGSYNLDPQVSDRYARIPFTLDLPAVEACVTGMQLTMPFRALTSDYRALQVDCDIWDGMTSSQDGTVVCQPFVVEGRSVGALAFAATTRSTLAPTESRAIEAAGSALGLWMSATHPASARPAPRGQANGTGYSLSPRQTRILLEIERGRSNESIAALLGYSRSTIKQDIRQMMASLRAHDRVQLAERARELHLLPDSPVAPVSVPALS